MPVCNFNPSRTRLPHLAHDFKVALKAANPLAWVRRMNSIQARVREMVNEELICN
jgi:hypothetical protein